MYPFTDKQLESIARWIIEQSSNPIDEIQDLLKSYMLNEPTNFVNIWEDIINEIDNY